MIVMDCFALPVEGTETRVNAQAAAYEYMAAYIENAKQVSRCCQALAEGVNRGGRPVLSNPMSELILDNFQGCVFKKWSGGLRRGYLKSSIVKLSVVT